MREICTSGSVRGGARQRPRLLGEIVTPARTIARRIEHPLPRIGHLLFLFELFLKPAAAHTGPAERGEGREEGADGREPEPNPPDPRQREKPADHAPPSARSRAALTRRQSA